MRRRTIAVVVLVVVLAATAVVLAGCDQIVGNAVKGAVEQQTGVKVDEKGGTVSIQGKDGQSVTVGGTQDGKLSEGFPTEFPQYPGATVKSSAKVTTAEGSMFTAEWTTTDPVDTIIKSYEEKLKAAGYEVTSSASSTTGGGVVSFKNAKQEGAVTVSTASSGGTTIAAVITVKP
jgi:hypothetical protein